MKAKNLFLAVVIGLQALWVLGTTFVQERALSEGVPILLETVPADPRDLLRGDYVILIYKISNLPLSLFHEPGTNGIAPGRTVYVTLEPVGEFYRATEASTEKAVPGQRGIVLKGRVEQSWGSGAGTTVHVTYGLERFYVREGTGNPQGKLTVQVAVPRSGNGRIKQVLIDGRPYAEAMKAAKR